MLRIFLHIILSYAVLATGFNAAAEPPSGQHEKWVKGQILVQHKAGLPPGRFKKLLAPEGADSAGSIPGINVHIISVPPGAEDKVIKALSHNPNIEFCEKDLYLQPTDYTPNDPRFVDAWHLQTMNLPGAWDISRGDEIIVAVVDSGVNGSHEDLSGKMVSGRNVASNNSDTSDIADHGTRVAGVIGAVMDNGLGVASIAPNALIMPVRVTNDPNGHASTSTLAAGIIWAADNGARVANVSYNISSSSVISTAADYMRSLGGLVVVSAGNSGTLSTFADSESIIAVSATTRNDVRASWSNYGNSIDVAAPGDGLWTTNSSGGYASASGTSFAAPATAATVALIMATNPLLSPVEVEGVLESSAVDLGDPGFDPVFGNGRVDALAAVLLAGGQTPIDNEPPMVAFANLQDGAAVSGLVVINATVSDNVGISKVELFDDQGLVGTDFTAPYSFSWDSARTGEGLDAALSLVAHDSQGNFGTQSMTVHVNDTTTEENAAPLVDLLVTQQGVPVRTLYPFNGAVVVTANVSDPNPGDDHVFDWSLTDNSLLPVSGTGNREYVMDADVLVPGVYTVRLTVTDNGSPAGSVSVEIVLNVVGTIPVLSDSRDQDGDGTSDAQEGLADSDQDGISDYLDAISMPSVLQGWDGISDQHLLVTELGLRLSMGATAMAADRISANVSVNDIARSGGIDGQPGINTDDTYEYAGGLFDFVISGLTELGQSVRVVLPQREPISEGALYRKYRANYGWQDFIIDSKNQVASARGSNGVCPAPGNDAYRNDLNTGDHCIQLTLEDGGPNDQDDLRNGVIRDPGGAASLPQSGSSDTLSGGSNGSGGGGGCAIDPAAKMDPLWVVLLLIPATGIQRRRLLRRRRSRL
jgi:thermitase